jgi:Ca2+/Na+ antiporter
MSNIAVETVAGTFFIVNIVAIGVIFYVIYLIIKTLHLSMKALKKYLKDQDVIYLKKRDHFFLLVANGLLIGILFAKLDIITSFELIPIIILYNLYHVRYYKYLKVQMDELKKNKTT